MEEDFSDDSFAWKTDSNQSSESDSEDMVKHAEKDVENSYELQSFENTSNSERRVKKRKFEGHNESPKRKKIKTEKESDNEKCKSVEEIRDDDNYIDSSGEGILKKIKNADRNSTKHNTYEIVVNDDENDFPITPKQERGIKHQKSKTVSEPRKKYKSRDVTNDDEKYLMIKAKEEECSFEKILSSKERYQSTNEETDEDGNYLTMKAKEESLSSEEVIKKSKKVSDNSKKYNSINDVRDDDDYLSMKAKQEIGCEEFDEPKKKRKKKCQELEFENINVEDTNGTHRPHEGEHTIIETPRISERIIFEDEKVEDIVRSRHLSNYLKVNPNLNPIIENSSNLPLITENDEIWELRCPNEMDVSLLSDKELNLGSQYKVKINGDSYYSTVKSEPIRVAIMTYEQNRCVIKNQLCKGVIDFRKRIPKLQIQSDGSTYQDPSHFIPLPETKIRHPLFGANYKKAIKVPKNVAYRLKSSSNLSNSLVMRTERKKKKKREKQLEETIKDEEVDAMQTETESDITVKKIKKEKRKERNTVHADGTERPQKEKKKSKHNFESVEVWESETKIKESLFNF